MMKATDYVLTPVDAYKGLRALTARHYIGLFAAVAVYIGVVLTISNDLAILVAGLVFMFATGASYRLPLVGAIGGLLVLMVLSPFAHDGNSIDGLSESLAVFVFFMLIFGVAKMIYDEVSGALFGKKDSPVVKPKQPNRPSPKPQHSNSRTPTRAVAPAPHPRPHHPRRPLQPQPAAPAVRAHLVQTKADKGNYLDLSKAQPVRARAPLNKPKPVHAPKPVRRTKRPQGLIQG